MESLARLGLLATCLLGVYVGLRTLAVWRRTRRIPELMIGTSALSVSLGGAVLGALAGLPMEERSVVLRAVALLALVAHVGAIYVGNWQIFRPADRWPLPLSLLALLVATGWGAASLSQPEASARIAIVYAGVRLAGQVWAMVECFRYSAMLRRRARIGLAEPMTAHRIWLWGVAASGQVVVLLADAACWYAIRTTLFHTESGLYLISALGLASTVALALAFFPPGAYVRLVARRWEPAGAEEAA